MGGRRRLEFGQLEHDAEETDAAVELACELLKGSAAASSQTSSCPEEDVDALDGVSFVECGLTAAHLKKLAAALQASRSSGAGASVLGVSKNPGIGSEFWQELFGFLPLEVTFLDFADNGLTDAC